LVLGVTEDWNDVAGQCYIESQLDTSVDSPIFRWLGDTFLPMLVNKSTDYPEPDEDEAANEALLHEPKCLESTLSRACRSQTAFPFCPLPRQVRHLKPWPTIYCLHDLDIFYMFAEMGNDKCTEMQLKFQDSPNPSLFVTTPKVDGTGLNLTAANHEVITQKFWVLNEQRPAFARIV
jgi:hypothetical protein